MLKKQETKKKEKVEKDSKKISQEEFEKKVLELSKEGLTSEKIGEKLRREGIHPSEYGKKISKILKERGSYASPERVKRHSEKNKQDKRAMREKERVFSQLRKLKMYYKAA